MKKQIIFTVAIFLVSATLVYAQSRSWTQQEVVSLAGGSTLLTSTERENDAVIATLTAITGLEFTALASTNYLIDCYIIASTSVSTTGISFAWDTPASPTRILMTGYVQTTAALTGGLFQRADNTNLGITTSLLTGASAENLVILRTLFQNGSTQGTMSLGFTPETAAQVSTVAGSICQYRTY